MKAHVYYDVTQDEYGRYVAMMSHGQQRELEGHYFQYVATYDIRGMGGSLPAIAERIWRDMNAVDGTERCVSLQVRSMSIGDVVVFDESEDDDYDAQVAMVAQGFGFGVTAFPHVTSPVGADQPALGR